MLKAREYNISRKVQWPRTLLELVGKPQSGDLRSMFDEAWRRILSELFPKISPQNTPQIILANKGSREIKISCKKNLNEETKQ